MVAGYSVDIADWQQQQSRHRICYARIACAEVDDAGWKIWKLYVTYFCCNILCSVQPTDDVHINLKSGYRLQAPNDCPPAISAIMLACWHQQPGSRPAFSQLKEKLKSLPPSACDPDGFKCDIKCVYNGASTCV